jgi:hypothetical protein
MTASGDAKQAGQRAALALDGCPPARLSASANFQL